MSHHTYIKRITAPDIAARKGGEPIVVLTSYHAQTAALVDPHVDVLMVVLHRGHDQPLSFPGAFVQNGIEGSIGYFDSYLRECQFFSSHSFMVKS